MTQTSRGKYGPAAGENWPKLALHCDDSTDKNGVLESLRQLAESVLAFVQDPHNNKTFAKMIIGFDVIRKCSFVERHRMAAIKKISKFGM